jgi:hypothetical protein
MSAQEMGSWAYWGIDQDAWEQGWRRTLHDAVEAAFAEGRIDEEAKIEIVVKKRSDNAVHDYRVVRSP